MSKDQTWERKIKCDPQQIIAEEIAALVDRIDANRKEGSELRRMLSEKMTEKNTMLHEEIIKRNAA